jgi:hypothetical protein
LHKCLATTNIIESPHSGVRRRTANVSRWRDSNMVEHWVASAWLLTEKHFRHIDGHEHLWGHLERLAAHGNCGRAHFCLAPKRTPDSQ